MKISLSCCQQNGKLTLIGRMILHQLQSMINSNIWRASHRKNLAGCKMSSGRGRLNSSGLLWDKEPEDALPHSESYLWIFQVRLHWDLSLGWVIKDKEGISKRWAKHLSSFPDRAFYFCPYCLQDHLTQKPVKKTDLPPTFLGSVKAVTKMSSGKAARKDEILSKLYKAAQPVALGAFSGILFNFW